MEITTNGMKLADFTEFYLAPIHKYLVIVFCEDISTGMKKEYCDFIDEYPTKNDLAQIMATGFKPYSFKHWLVESLTD